MKTLYGLEVKFHFAGFSDTQTTVPRKLFNTYGEANDYFIEYLEKTMMKYCEHPMFRPERESFTYKVLDFEAPLN